jgi:DNA-binding beta-propeller fold protein YncE
VRTGHQPFDITVDSAGRRVYVSDYAHATMSVIDAGACNARHPAGCALPTREIAVGYWPRDAALDRASGTLYVVAANFTAVSLVDTRH